MEKNLIDLATLAEGALQEMANIEMQKIMDNIADINTKQKAKRSMTITIDFMPNDTRSVIDTSISVKAKLVGRNGTTTSFLIGETGDGKVTGGEMKSNTPGQLFINQEGEVADDFGDKLSETGETKVAKLFK